MFVVIFRAKINEPDEQYESTAAELRELARAEYHCAGFHAVAENGVEIALSYWHSLEDIENWKNDPAHKSAQEKGRRKYYQSYEVQVARIERQYAFTT